MTHESKTPASLLGHERLILYLTRLVSCCADLQQTFSLDRLEPFRELVGAHGGQGRTARIPLGAQHCRTRTPEQG